MRTGKPNDAKPGEIYISPESMDVLKFLYPPGTDITTGDLPHIRWADIGLDRFGTCSGGPCLYKLHTISGTGANRVDHITWVTKEWAELFLKNWNQAVMLWDKGHLFNDVWSKEEYQKEQLRDQQEYARQEYARICCSWIIPNGMVEPHCTADDLPEDCDCWDCLSKKVEKEYERIDAYREFRDDLRGGGAWE